MYLLGGVTPFNVLKQITTNLTAGGTYTVPGWNMGTLLLIRTAAHSGDTGHLYFGDSALHAGSSLKLTFSEGIITSTDSITQGLYITALYTIS